MDADQYKKHEADLFNGNLSKDQVASYYDHWAEGGRYDQEIIETLRAPTVTADTTASLYPESQRATVEVLDVGAGTGLATERLRQLGFEQIDALDPSQGMLDKAKKKNLYRRYVCDFLTKDTLVDANGHYDCVICSASFCPGHIPAEALIDFIRLTKKGGQIVIAMRDEWEAPGYSDSVKSMMSRLENEGRWQKVREEQYQHYFDKPGLVYVFKVL